jgi:3'(2'), 5'-bisphosphate nucleotidase
MNDDDQALAEEAASRAGRVLLELHDAGALTSEALGRAGDLQANAAIVALLRAQRPADGLLSEELAPDLTRLERRRVWIVDPLDGTREYRDPVRRTDWAVHVALCVDGVPTACTVGLPALGETWSSGRVRPLAPVLPGRTRVLVSRTRPPAFASRLADRLDADLVPMGSAGAKAMAVVRGEAQVYVHAGGLNEWDSCAPVGVALAFGLHASRLDGSPCRYNQADPSMPDLLICRPEWAHRVLDLLAADRPQRLA